MFISKSQIENCVQSKYNIFFQINFQRRKIEKRTNVNATHVELLLVGLDGAHLLRLPLRQRQALRLLLLRRLLLVRRVLRSLGSAANKLKL